MLCCRITYAGYVHIVRVLGQFEHTTGKVADTLLLTNSRIIYGLYYFDMRLLSIIGIWTCIYALTMGHIYL